MYLQVPELPHNTQTAAGQECVLSRKQEVLLQSECSVWPAINQSTSPADSSRTPARSATVGAVHKKLKIILLYQNCLNCFEKPKSVKHCHLEDSPSAATIQKLIQVQTKAFITSLKQIKTLLPTEHAQCGCGFGSGTKIPQEERSDSCSRHDAAANTNQMYCTRKRLTLVECGNIYVFISLPCTK